MRFVLIFCIFAAVLVVQGRREKVATHENDLLFEETYIYFGAWVCVCGSDVGEDGGDLVEVVEHHVHGGSIIGILPPTFFQQDSNLIGASWRWRHPVPLLAYLFPRFRVTHARIRHPTWGIWKRGGDK